MFEKQFLNDGKELKKPVQNGKNPGGDPSYYIFSPFALAERDMYAHIKVQYGK